jgi:NADH-quinone oxidoreductase subunit E
MECRCTGKQTSSCSTIDTALLEPYLVQCEASGGKGNLIAILQKAQDIYGYLPVEILVHIARRMDIKPAKIMGVVTFYTRFRTKPVGKHLILLCQGTACHVNGSSAIEETIRETLGIEEGGISDDGLFTYTNVACIGCCSLAPVMMIGEKTYGRLTKEKTIKILKDIEQEERRQMNEDNGRKGQLRNSRRSL